MSIDTSKLLKKDTIVFGPFVGEFDYEVYNWSGYIRWFKLRYPKKTVIVSTRENRKDLYIDIADGLELFNIEEDYADYRPKSNLSPNLPPYMMNEISTYLEETYPDALIIDPNSYPSGSEIFPMDHCDYNYKPTLINSTVIQGLVTPNVGEKKRVPITIFTSTRKDKNKNWDDSRWMILFDAIEKSNRFVCMVGGLRPGMFRAESHRKYFYNLEDYVNPKIGTSISGLTIEAIRSSKFTASPQSSAVVLANVLKIPSLIWGDSGNRLQVEMNPFGIKVDFISDITYNMDPISIYNRIMKLSL
jgi:hypothetical protein